MVDDGGETTVDAAFSLVADETRVDIRETPMRDLEWLFDGDASVTNKEPLRVEFAIEREDGRLEITLDETFSVVEHGRRYDDRERPGSGA